MTDRPQDAPLLDDAPPDDASPQDAPQNGAPQNGDAPSTDPQNGDPQNDAWRMDVLRRTYLGYASQMITMYAYTTALINSPLADEIPTPWLEKIRSMSSELSAKCSAEICRRDSTPNEDDDDLAEILTSRVLAEKQAAKAKIRIVLEAEAEPEPVNREAKAGASQVEASGGVGQYL